MKEIKLYRTSAEFTVTSDNSNCRAVLRLKMEYLEDTLKLDNIKIMLAYTSFRLVFPKFLNRDGSLSEYDLASDSAMHQFIFKEYDEYLGKHITTLPCTYRMFETWAENTQQGKYNHYSRTAPETPLTLSSADAERLKTLTEFSLDTDFLLEPNQLINKSHDFDGYTLRMSKWIGGSSRIAEISVFMSSPLGAVNLNPIPIRYKNEAFFADISALGFTIHHSADRKRLAQRVMAVFHSFIEQYRFHEDIQKVYIKFQQWRNSLADGNA